MASRRIGKVHGAGFAFSRARNPAVELGKEGIRLVGLGNEGGMAAVRSQDLAFAPEGHDDAHGNGFLTHGHVHGRFHLIPGVMRNDQLLGPADEGQAPVEFKVKIAHAR